MTRTELWLGKNEMAPLDSERIGPARPSIINTLRLDVWPDACELCQSGGSPSYYARSESRDSVA